MPGCAVDPNTHNHKEHAISNDDRKFYVDGESVTDLDGIDDGKPHHVAVASGQPVTVADLLDAYDNDSPGFPDINGRRASASVWRSFCNVSNVLAEYRSLSPSERSEFDRRTT